MSCKNFEAIIPDLARGQMLEATVRESALSHVEECADCAMMLERERALTAELRGLAASMQEMEAPARLEDNLRALFRERTAAADRSPVVVSMPQRNTGWQRWYPQAAAAAVLLMFAIGGAVIVRTRQGQATATQTSAVASNNNSAAIQTASVDSEAAKSQSEVESPTVAAADNSDREPGQKLSRSEVAAIMGTTTPRRNSVVNVPRAAVNNSRMASTSGEIATDFMPVSYGDNLNEIENGRIVRVEMPRSALAQFGLPVNMDRANERIKADVLIGDDGMARAIRFVR